MEYGQAKKQAVVWGLNQRESQGCDLSREGGERSQVKVENRGQQSPEHSQVWVKVKLPGLCGLGLSRAKGRRPESEA